MLPVAFGLIVFFCLLVGAVAFLVCVLLPPFRRYALSVALWFASWGPCAISLMLLAGLALVAEASTIKSEGLQLAHIQKLLSTFGWGYLIVGVVCTACVATVAAWVHQFVVRRFTFALFRLYATLVVAGIGSVFGWSLSWWMLTMDVPRTWVWSLLGMVLLVIAFGAAAWKGARGLRGDAPTKLSWISKEEFSGS
jgi:hypothetical protein